MTVLRSTSVCRVILVCGAVAMAACSSSTGPSSISTLALIDRFDTLSNATGDANRAATFRFIAQTLASGAPLGTATIAVNGVSGEYTIIAQLLVTDFTAQATDSEYDVTAWKGRTPDTVISFSVSVGGAAATEVSTLDSTLISFDATANVTFASPGVNCRSLAALAPADLFPPVPIRCQIETVSAAFTGMLHDAAGDRIELPNQTVRSIRFETQASPPAP